MRIAAFFATTALLSCGQVDERENLGSAATTIGVERLDTELRLNAGSAAPINDYGEGVFDLLVTEAARRCGHTTAWVHVPPQRSLTLVSTGHDDGDGPRIREMDEIVPGLARVDEPVLRYEFVAVTRDPAMQVGSWQDFLPHDVAIVRGWKIAERQLSEARSLTSVRNFDLAYELLRNGRVDIVLAEKLSALHAIGDDPTLHVLEPFASRDMYLFLSEPARSSPNLLPRLSVS